MSVKTYFQPAKIGGTEIQDVNGMKMEGTRKVKEYNMKAIKTNPTIYREIRAGTQILRRIGVWVLSPSTSFSILAAFYLSLYLLVLSLV